MNAIASSNYQPKGVREGRAAHVTAKATDSIADRSGCWTSSGSQAAARRERTRRNRRGPTWQPSRAKTGRIKPDGGKRAEPGGSPRGPKYRGRRAAKRAGGKGPCFDRACKEVSARACRKRTKTPMKKYDNSNASYMCVPSRVGRGDSMRCTTGSTGVTFCGKHGGGCVATAARQG